MGHLETRVKAMNLIKQNAWMKRTALSLLNWYQQTLGASPLNWPKVPGELIWFFDARRNYRRQAPPPDKLYTYPILFQRKTMEFDAHYTYQSAWAMRRILETKPKEHVDIASDLRFVTMLSACIPVTYVEYRPIRIDLGGLTVRQGSVLQLPFDDRSVVSLSCLHVVEHIGLGRYGDILDVNGPRKAFHELVRVVAPGGSLFVSLPIGRPRTLFNAHRIFHPQAIFAMIDDLQLREFSVVTTRGEFIQRTDPAQYAEEDYACGHYWFTR